MKIKVFYGPRKAFDEILPKGIRPKTLTKLVEISDYKRHNIYVDYPNKTKENRRKQSFKNVIATTEEYALLSDSGLNGLITLLDEFSIENIYFQNPPSSIVSQLEEVYRKIGRDNYLYKNIQTKTLKIFANKFTSEILGQETAKNKLLMNLYQLAKNYNKGKPIVLMLYGPAGVGKTETAKLLSSVLGQHLFRKQFSMFHTNSFADYIFGASHNSSSLSRDLLERESNVILFDEFDKPDNMFYSAFYQMFDEGEFEDKNYQVNLKNSIIFCTSNFTNECEIKRELGEAIYSRFDAFIEYKALRKEVVNQLISKSFDKLINSLDNDDRKRIDKQECLDILLANSSNLQNARELDKFVNEYVFSRILKATFS